MTIIIGYILSIVVGLIMGLLGGGGSILAVPIFVYLFGIPASVASGYSLFVVGSAAVLGAYQYHRQQLLHIHVGLLFGIPSIIGVYMSRRYIVPSLPSVIIDVPFTLLKNQLILIVFALLMMVASIFMIRKRKSAQQPTPTTPISFWIVLVGLGVGILTGFVGAGGGFIIIPALIAFARIDMKQAVATSLFIIAMSSLLGFMGDLHAPHTIDWLFLIKFLSLAALGLWAGIGLNKKVSNEKLKPLFGYFVLCIGIAMLVKEIFF